MVYQDFAKCQGDLRSLTAELAKKVHGAQAVAAGAEMAMGLGVPLGEDGYIPTLWMNIPRVGPWDVAQGDGILDQHIF